MLTRRDALLAAAAAGLVGAADPTPDLPAIRATLAGGRLGVAAIDLASGRRLALDPDGRVAHCSVFKLPLVAAVLSLVDAGALSLARMVRYGPADVIGHAPVTQAHLAAGSLSVAALCAAAMTQSDNGAANLLLPLVGGPAGLTRWARRLGDTVTRFDRNELGLNSNQPGDPRDTTSPAAMLALTRRLVAGDALTPASRALLVGWMAACATGEHRLRAAFPPGWRAGDRTGTGERGAVNDVAVAWPVPDRPPLIVACFVDAPAIDTAAAEAAIAAVGRLAVARLVA